MDTKALKPCPFCGATTTNIIRIDDARLERAGINFAIIEDGSPAANFEEAAFYEAAAARGRAPEAVAFVSAEQLEAMPPDPDDDGGCQYLPVRHSARGKFQMPLYATPPAPQPIGSDTCPLDGRVSASRELIATAIANARGNRRGVPTIKNILDILPEKLLDEVLDDADAVIDALATPALPVEPPVIREHFDGHFTAGWPRPKLEGGE